MLFFCVLVQTFLLCVEVPSRSWKTRNSTGLLLWLCTKLVI